MTWHSLKKKKKREKTCCAFVNSPFHVPTPGFSFSPPCITTSNRGFQANSHPLYPQGGGWLSQSAHLLCCFYYDSHLSLAPVAYLSSPDSQNMRCHDTSFYRKKDGEILVSLFMPEGLHVSLKAAVRLLMCWRGSRPRRHGWITLKRCVYVWVLTTSPTSDLSQKLRINIPTCTWLCCTSLPMLPSDDSTHLHCCLYWF